MKQFILHRVNQSAQLNSVEPAWGVEIDLRADVSKPGEIYLAHDAWEKGESFEKWLECFAAKKIQGPILLNTKEDGLEKRCIELLEQNDVKNYYFIDTPVPTLVRWVELGNRKFAIRYSSFEPESYVEKFVGKSEWLWVDCFEGKPLDPKTLSKWKGKFRICLVSPELHGRPLSEIKEFESVYRVADAVCTKDPASWIKLFGNVD